MTQNKIELPLREELIGALDRALVSTRDLKSDHVVLEIREAEAIRHILQPEEAPREHKCTLEPYLALGCVTCDKIVDSELPDDLKQSFDSAKLRAIRKFVAQDTDDWESGIGMIVAMIDCPKHDPMHYHHDGCTSLCDQDGPQENASNYGLELATEQAECRVTLEQINKGAADALLVEWTPTLDQHQRSFIVRDILCEMGIAFDD